MRRAHQSNGRRIVKIWQPVNDGRTPGTKAHANLAACQRCANSQARRLARSGGRPRLCRSASGQGLTIWPGPFIRLGPNIQSEPTPIRVDPAKRTLRRELSPNTKRPALGRASCAFCLCVRVRANAEVTRRPAPRRQEPQRPPRQERLPRPAWRP